MKLSFRSHRAYQWIYFPLMIVVLCIFLSWAFVDARKSTIRYADGSIVDIKGNEQNEKKEYARVYISRHLNIVPDEPVSSNDELILKGAIQNKGNRAVDKIVLTVYFLDDKGFITDRQKENLASSNGKPLKRYERRPYAVRIRDVSNLTKTVYPMITDIEFAPDSP